MVRTEQEKIVFSEKREKLPEFCIESLDLPRVALRIPSVPVERAKISEIYEAKPRRFPLSRDLYRLLHAVYGAFGADRLRDPLPDKDIIDLSDGDHVIALLLQHIQHRAPRGL